jgi:hypothetical protein
MRFVVALTLLVAVPAAAEAALPRWNPKAPENSELMPSFSLGSVGNVLTAVGARYQRSGSDASKPALLATFPNGRKALITLSSCDRGGGCKALSIQSFWTKLAKAPPERTAKAIEQFNERFAFAKAYITPDGRPSLQRYLVADYGFIRGNLAVNLLVFADQAERLAVDVLQPLEREGK